MRVGLGCAVATGLEIGNANAGATEEDRVADSAEDGDDVALRDGEALGVGLGVGEGEMIFSQ